MNSEMNEFNRDKWKIPRWTKYTASLIASVFLAFVLGWLFLIPAIAVVLLTYGLIVYLKERKHKIVVTIKPTEAMKAIARREADLQNEKEHLMYEAEHSEVK
jgi:hypothetical protein